MRAFLEVLRRKGRALGEKQRMAAALLLAALIAFSSLPAAAEEGSSVVDSAAEEFSDLMPYSWVKDVCEGGTKYLSDYGVTREEIVRELSSHEHDNYYLKTPYIGGDHQSPNGDPSYNGAPGLNCAGFIGYVLRKCGLDTTAALKVIRSHDFALWGSGLKYDELSCASNYFNFVRYGKLKAFVFPSKQAMLQSGKCEKGDIILRFWTHQFTGNDMDNHMMIFWGNKPSEDKIWHSPAWYNDIGTLAEGYGASFILIKPSPSSPPVAGFEDVWEKDWFGNAVRFVKEHGLMDGVSAERFSPNTPMTRAQLVTILYRAAGEPAAMTENRYSDVFEGTWYVDAVNWARESGIVTGYGDGLFHPHQSVSRQEAATILQRFCMARGLDSGWADETDLLAFSDADEINDYARNAMAWAYRTELITGVSSSQLSPRGKASRAQMAQILMRLCIRYEIGTDQ